MASIAKTIDPQVRRNANQNTVAIAVGLFSIVQLLLLSVYFDYAFGYLVSSIGLGSLAFFVMSHLSRRKDVMVEGNFADVEDHYQIGSDLFDDLPVPMINANETGEILQANTAACVLIGRDDLVGASLDTVVEGLGRSIRDRISDTLKGFGLGRPEMARCQRNQLEVIFKSLCPK